MGLCFELVLRVALDFFMSCLFYAYIWLESFLILCFLLLLIFSLFFHSLLISLISTFFTDLIICSSFHSFLFCKFSFPISYTKLFCSLSLFVSCVIKLCMFFSSLLILYGYTLFSCVLSY